MTFSGTIIGNIGNINSLTINGGGKLLGNVSAEMVIITENGSIKGDVACKMLKIGFEASIIGRIYVHLTATSGSKIVMKDESMTIMENGCSTEMRSVSKSAEHFEPHREDHDFKESMPSLKILTPTGKEKKVKEIKDIKNLRYMDDKMERNIGVDEMAPRLSTGVIAKSHQHPHSHSHQLPSDALKSNFNEVDTLSILTLKDQVVGLIESERERSRERGREKEREQSTDRSGVKFDGENLEEEKGEIDKKAVAGDDEEEDDHDVKVKVKDEEEDFERAETGKEDTFAKETKKVRKEKEKSKTDRQYSEQKATKGSNDEKHLRGVKSKTDSARGSMEREMEQIELDEQRVSASASDVTLVSPSPSRSLSIGFGMNEVEVEDFRALNTKRESTGARTQSGEMQAKTSQKSRDKGKNDDSVYRKDEDEKGSRNSEMTAVTVEVKVDVDSSRRIEIEENALRLKEEENYGKSPYKEVQLGEIAEDGKGEGGERKRQEIANIDIVAQGPDQRCYETLDKMSDCVEANEVVSAKHRVIKHESNAGSGDKLVEKTQILDKKERSENSARDKAKTDNLRSEEDRQTVSGDMHGIASSTVAEKASSDVTNTPAVTHVEVGELRALQGQVSLSDKGRKKEIREERRRLSKFMMGAEALKVVVDEDAVAREVTPRGVKVERERDRERKGSVGRRANVDDVDVKHMIKTGHVGDEVEGEGEVEGNRQPIRDEEGEGEEQDSLDGTDHQHIQVAKIRGNTGSRPGSHIPATFK